MLPSFLSSFIEIGGGEFGKPVVSVRCAFRFARDGRRRGGCREMEGKEGVIVVRIKREELELKDVVEQFFCFFSPPPAFRCASFRR